MEVTKSRERETRLECVGNCRDCLGGSNTIISYYIYIDERLYFIENLGRIQISFELLILGHHYKISNQNITNNISFCLNGVGLSSLFFPHFVFFFVFFFFWPIPAEFELIPLVNRDYVLRCLFIVLILYEACTGTGTGTGITYSSSNLCLLFSNI